MPLLSSTTLMLWDLSHHPIREFFTTSSIIRKWPALSISLAITIVSYSIFFALAAAGWPGQVTSNCYEDYLVTADCYCERLRGDKPGDVWFAQPMNTVSNLWFVVAGLLIAYSSDSRSFPSKAWWQENPKGSEAGTNLIIQDEIYSIVYAVDACLLGIGSTFLHASFTTYGRQLDMIAMYFLATFGVLYPLLNRGHINKQQAIKLYISTNLALIYYTVSMGTPQATRKLFTTLLVMSWVIEIFWIDQKVAQREVPARKMFLRNLAVFLFAVVVWKSSESGGPICYPDSLWQGHSLWHFFSAAFIAGSYFYYLAEFNPVWNDVDASPVVQQQPDAVVSSDRSLPEAQSISQQDSSVSERTLPETQSISCSSTEASSLHSSEEDTNYNDDFDYEQTLESESPCQFLLNVFLFRKHHDKAIVS